MIETLIDVLDAKNEVVIATILSKSGSAPREIGTKMLINKDGSIHGTIGGGILEAMAIKLSSTVFESKEALVEDFELSDNEATSIGMICGGEVRVLLEYLCLCNTKAVELFRKADALKKMSDAFVMITRISKQPEHWICTEEELFGSENKKVNALASALRETFYQTKFHLHVENETYMIEPFVSNNNLYIIGAGHVGQQIAKLAHSVEFTVFIADDRAEFANKERFPMAKEICVLSSYEAFLKEMLVTKNSYIVIVTRGSTPDKITLKQALGTHPKYVGMIGSKTKKNHVYSDLLKEGVRQSELDGVHCPIGMSIHAQTPEEIAISIVAELIHARRS